MEKRPKERIDFKILSSTGERVVRTDQQEFHGTDSTTELNADNLINSSNQLFINSIVSNQSSEEAQLTQPSSINSNMDKNSDVIDKLLIIESTLQDEIIDTMEDNAPDIIGGSIELMKSAIQKIESLRMQYRTKHRELKHHLDDKYEELHHKSYARTIADISAYIKNFNQLIQHHHLVHTESAKEINDEKALFIIEDIKRSMKYIKASSTCNVNRIENDDLKRRKSQLQSQNTELRSISEKLKELIGLRPNIGTYNELRKEYEILFEAHKQYETNINDAMKSREINKLESFKKSKLNINLPTFSGYESSVDIYTFNSDFNKLYSETVPKSLQSDLLKNNHLAKYALSLVKNVNDIDEIWVRLKAAFGDRQFLLANKLSQLTSYDFKHRDPVKVSESLSKVTYTMRDLMFLASTHNIENELYYGDALARIINMLGDYRMTRWLTTSCENPKEGKAKWKQLIEFLEKELKIQQQKTVIQASNKSISSSKQSTSKLPNASNKSAHSSYDVNNSNGEDQSSTTDCIICDASNHVQTNGPRGTKLVQYFACKKFVDMTPAERFQHLQSKGLCFQCLYPGAQRNQGKHKDGKCQRDFICKHSSHNKYPTKKHILVCDEHKDDQQNKDVLEYYKARCIMKQPVPQYSKDIQIFTSHLCTLENGEHQEDISVNTSSGNQFNDAIFMLQNIKVDGNSYTIFYDSGCCDFISRYQAINQLGSRAVQQYFGTIKMGGVGGATTISKHGIYRVSIPLINGYQAVMTGACMDRITQKFPYYPLKGEVFNDIKIQYEKEGNNSSNLPSVPHSVGGDVDFMIGIKYLRYFPEIVFQMPSGLTIYKAQFFNADGSCGVIGGPHELFNNLGRAQSTSFILNQFQLYQQGYHINPDVRMLGYRDQLGDIAFTQSSSSNDDSPTQKFDVFNEVERAGSEIFYRCIDCRGCSTCSNQSNEIMSVKEEAEQEVINKSVIVNTINHNTIATLPLMCDPTMRLVPNRDIALKVFNQQMKRLSKNSKDKNDVIKSEQKLQTLGYVDYVKNLPDDIQQMLKYSQFRNFIPWRAVWKENSISTPCRVVFDASMPTKSGYSLNDMLAKGRNNMNRLVDIFIRWRGHAVAFHTDVQKMYNSVNLYPTHWGLQRYLWQESLDPALPPEEKVIKTLIYGVKSSGNQAERGLRETARLLQDDYPDINRIVSEDVYVDDCLSGAPSTPESSSTADNLEVVVNYGGFTLKGFTFSGQLPLQTLSSDGVSVLVAGLKWYSEEDTISLDVQELNFVKKSRGRKQKSILEVPTNLTRRQCVSKVAELYDITGLITPIIATLKIDLHELVKRKMEWDDILPDNLRSIWVSHFQLMKEIGNIRYKRAVIPEDAVSLDVETLDFGDASQALVCVTIYIRFKRKNGLFSCQLIFARSRIIPEGYSQPRAELFAAVVNTHTGQIVKRAFGDKHKSSMKFTDSQITLFWICNTNLQLKQWTRNRVTEILRFTNQSQWKYVCSKDMIADLGTRRCTSIDIVQPDSVWINGFQWMQEDHSNFPAMSTADISLNAQDVQHLKKESKDPLPHERTCFLKLPNQKVPDDVAQRYKYSKYLIDPNSRRFQSVVRVMAYILRFIQNCRKRQPLSIQNDGALTDEEINASERYFFFKTSEEVKKFVQPSKYEKISHEKDGILRYIGRILPTDQVSIIGKATDVMIDLCTLSFFVPIVDKCSPLAYSIVNEIHWHHPTASHCGVETTWRYVLQRIFIIEGRSLVKMIRSSCQRCKYLMKLHFDVSMGPLSQDNLTIAPAFFVTQTDLAGPFSSFSQHHKRTTVKIWLIVFCCATTTAVKIKVMEDYSTTSFLQAFARFACEVGYPKKLLVDEGSQLIKGCESMRLNFSDIKYQLHINTKVQYETCPVGGHNMHGRVEQKIRQIRQSIDKSVHNQRLSIIHWETLSSTIANSINNLPIAVRNIKADFEVMDLITPNRLLLGRNNDRCPVGRLEVSNDYNKFIEASKKIFNTWFECWLTSHVPSLMYQPKWFDSNKDMKPGDIVLFTKQESSLSSMYQYGMVKSVKRGRDDKIRTIVVVYQNANEKSKRETTRAARSLVVIHNVDDIDISKELFNLRFIG